MEQNRAKKSNLEQLQQLPLDNFILNVEDIFKESYQQKLPIAGLTQYFKNGKYEWVGCQCHEIDLANDRLRIKFRDFPIEKYVYR